jgi:DHA1 family multidrug resistance protein-like MFS transporter
LVGPLVGGAIADQTHSYRTAYFVASGMALLVTLACIAFIHERFEPVRRNAAGASIADQLRELIQHPALLPLLAVMFLTQITVLAAGPIIPLVVRAFVGSGDWLATAAGFAIAVTGLADVIASPWLGKRSDVIGYRKVLIISLAGAVIFTFPQAFASNYWTFTALRFGVGIFLGGILPSANALLARTFAREQRGQIFGLASSATFMGMFLGPLLGGLVAARFGFSAVFMLIGTLSLLNLGVVVRMRERAMA